MITETIKEVLQAIISFKYLSGFITCYAISILYQDFYGMDLYIETIKSGWIDSKKTIATALILLIIAAVFACI